MRRVRVPRPISDDSAQLIDRAVAAFSRGGRELLLSRLEAGVWCWRLYGVQSAAGISRKQTTRILTDALAPFAQSKRDGSPAPLARYFGIASVLGGVTADDLAGGRAVLGDLTLT